jgi:hypothetical protein
MGGQQMNTRKIIMSLTVVFWSSVSMAWMNCSGVDGLVRVDRAETGSAQPRGWSYTGSDKTLPTVEERFDRRHRLVLLSSPTYMLFTIPVELYGVKNSLIARTTVTCGGQTTHAGEPADWRPEISNATDLLK